MKRLLVLALLPLAGLAGCGQEKSIAPAAKSVEKKAEVNASPTISLLEQINRENIALLSGAMPAIVRITAHSPPEQRLQIIAKEMPIPVKPHRFRPADVAYGSGVVISKDGYVVTNNHVIDNAQSVEVQLQDKRSFPARVVASDSPMDIAVLKIDAADLATLPWGNSDQVKIGEQVFAIGNPFNLDDSASKGIVSATGRNLPDGPSESVRYENFIQTDAAINPGNSGGALINIRGELIGINTAIASTSRGSMGVGFAIPSNLARYTVEGLLKNGRMIRGYLGVKLPQAVDEGVEAELKLDGQGALLAGVQKDSPADKAGLRAGDFLTEVGGHKIGSAAEFRLVESQLPIGKEVAIQYIRSGTPQNVQVMIVESPEAKPTNDNAAIAIAVIEKGGVKVNAENVLNGLQVSDLDSALRQKYRIDAAVVAGVIVIGVADGSIASTKGIQEGDMLESSVNRGVTKPLTSAKDFADLAGSLSPDQGIVLLVRQPRASRFVYLTPVK